MNVKTIVQLLIFLITFIFIFFIVKNTFFSKKKNIINLDLEDKIISENVIVNENKTNVIEKLNYKSIDTNGNEYYLNAELGVISEENPDILILENVSGKLKLNNKSDIEIYADFAKYNSKSFDTYFYQNVSGFFEDSKVYADNFDLLFNSSKAILYNNISFFDKNTLAKADEILLDLISGDINIKMLDKEKKIQIIKN